MIELTLARDYEKNKHRIVRWDDWMVSEKLDGVRAFWDCDQFITRNNKPIYAPEWFVSQMPKEVMLDGELFIGRGLFEKTSGTVRKRTPIDKEWKKVVFRAFDIHYPLHNLPFEKRYKTLLKMKKDYGKKQDAWDVVTHEILESEAELMRHLKTVREVGGEGLMIRNKTMWYEGGRTNYLLKLKPSIICKAVVVGYKDGKGKYTGMLGSLICETKDKKQFCCSGMDDEMRSNPPALGTVIKVEYNDKTKNGIPRFPRFIKVVDEKE